MNKLVIIGNGFDLAHGLKTKYEDFILHYFKKSLLTTYDIPGLIFEDDLISIERKASFNDSVETFLANIHTINEALNNSLINYNFDNSSPKKHSVVFNFTVKSPFLWRIINKFNQANWVDIEMEYYEHLFELSTTNDSLKKKTNEIKKLNDSLNIIAFELKEYLNTISLSNFKTINDDFKRKISQLLFSPMKSVPTPIGRNQESLILNYNYTSTVEEYLSLRPEKYKVQIVNIHGTLKPNDSIILGYGHIQDEKYQAIESIEFNPALDFIKQYLYTLKDHQQKLIQFISKSDFEAIIIGHSCGKSDGTTLQAIFGHTNCKIITITHISEAEFTNKHKDIKRIIGPDQSFHYKINPYNSNLKIPQLSEFPIEKPIKIW